MTRERIALMEKARAKRQRRVERKAAKKTARTADSQDLSPNAGFSAKVALLAQGAVAQVSELVDVVAAKLSFVDPKATP